jgi:hypothetical protein
MKKFAFLGWLILLAVLVAACQSTGAKIKPGDKIGEMEFINEWENCQAPNILYDLCTEKEVVFDGTCTVPASQNKFWISTGWMEGSQESMELSWKDSEWSMTFDGYQVDLTAFGTFDMDWTDPTGKVKDVQKARIWNVCVFNPAPGKHVVRYEYTLKNGVWRGNHELVFNFTVLADDSP